MSDYSKAVIYSLKSEEDIFDSNIYIGSTCDLKKRITAHKSSMKNIKSADSHTKKSKYFKKTNGSFVYEILLSFPCKNRQELLKKESEIIKAIKPTLNSYSPYNTYQDRHLKRRYNQKAYYLKNKQRLKENTIRNYSLRKQKQYNNTLKYAIVILIINVLIHLILMCVYFILVLLKNQLDKYDY